MAHSNVSGSVLAIVGSFSSGLDVFKQLKLRRENRGKRKHTGRKKSSNEEEEEMRLSRSLRQGPEDIGREYARSVYAVGDGFAVGDGMAQTSLAEILLRLNTGLVGIMSWFLSSERKTGLQPDYQALTHLSDRSRIDTCRALRQLFKRMTQPPPLPAISQNTSERQRQQSPKRKRKPSSTGHTKVKGPMLARVVIQDSSKPSQIAMVKPSERRKKSGSSSSSELSKASGSSTPTTPPPEYAPEPPPRPVAVRSTTAPPVPAASKPRRKHSAAVLPTQNIPQADPTPRAARSTPWLPTTLEQPDALPTLPPLPSRPPLPRRDLPRHRKPTPTYYSTFSDSTRLGEIPLHKRHAPYDFDKMSVLNREAEMKGWPGNDLGAGSEVGGRKRGWGLRRLFGRK